MIHYFQLDENKHLKRVNTPSEANWIHLTQPTPQIIEEFAKAYDFPKDYLTGALDPHEVPRHGGLEQDNVNQPLLLLLQSPQKVITDNGLKEFRVSPFSLVFTPNCLITCSKYSLPTADKITKLNLKQNQLPTTERISLQLNWYFSALFNQYLAEILAETEELEAQLKTATENQQLFQLMDLQKSLVYFQAALTQNLSVMKKASTTPLLMTTSESLEALSDIQIEIEQALNSTKIISELLNQLSNSFSAIVGNNLNSIMKTLTVITIVLTIPTIIGGIYGMNVALPLANGANIFWWLLLLILLLSLGTVWFLRKKKFF